MHVLPRIGDVGQTSELSKGSSDPQMDEYQSTVHGPVCQEHPQLNLESVSSVDP